MPRAQTYALTCLSNNHWEEYRKLYLKKREELRELGELYLYAKAQTFAKVFLAGKYRDEYQTLYQEGLSRGYTRNKNNARPNDRHLVGKES